MPTPPKSGAAGTVPRIAALGYYGFGNLGDEAVLAGIRASLSDTLGDTDFCVLTADSAATRSLHGATVQTADRWKLRNLSQTLRGTDLFVFGGGSLLQDATSAKSVVWYAVAATIARRRARKVLWWAQGVGPLNKPVSRRIVRSIANQADAITVRDSKSASLLKDIGVRASIELVADAAFALPVPPTHSEPAESYSLLALRDWKENALSRAIPGETLIQAIRSGAHCDRVAVVAMHLPEDAHFASQYLAGASSDHRTHVEMPGDGWSEMLSTWGQAKLVVAMRLHALIFAARMGTPFVALSYDPKVDALARASGQEDALLSLNTLDTDTFVGAVTRVAQTSEVRRQALRRYAAEQNVLARRPAKIAAELL